MDKFSSLFYNYTDGKYDYLRIKNVDVNTEARTANVYIYVRDDKYDNFDNAVIKELRAFFGEIVKKYTFNFYFERLLVSADIVHRSLTEYINVNFPFVAANILFDSIDVYASADAIECTVYMPESIRQYAEECGFVASAETHLTDAFIMPAHLAIELTDVVVEENNTDNAQRLFTVVPVDDIKYLCGVKSEYSRLPTMMRYVKQAAERVAVCGEMSEMRVNVYEQEPPKEGEESKRRFYKYRYSFMLYDGTESMRVLFGTNDDKCPLKDITAGQFMVRGRVFYNERTGSFNVYAKTVYRCAIDKASLAEMLKPLPPPETYRIQPAEVEEIPRTVQLSLGLDGEDAPSGKRLSGKYVFLYMRSLAKDKLVPYELCALRVNDGQPVEKYTTYIYTSDLIEIDVAIKSSVSTAPRISDVVPDLVKFFEGTTVVALQLDKVQPYLTDIAKALRYVFACDWTDGSILLKKGKETLSFAKACKQKHIEITSDAADAHARALFELYLAEKGVG